jgi:hypothetical protein
LRTSLVRVLALAAADVEVDDQVVVVAVEVEPTVISESSAVAVVVEVADQDMVEDSEDPQLLLMEADSVAHPLLLLMVELHLMAAAVVAGMEADLMETLQLVDRVNLGGKFAIRRHSFSIRLR